MNENPQIQTDLNMSRRPQAVTLPELISCPSERGSAPAPRYLKEESFEAPFQSEFQTLPAKVEAPAEKVPSVILKISWEQNARFRPNKETDDSMMVVDPHGPGRVTLTKLLCANLEGLISKWAKGNQNDIERYATQSVADAREHVLEAKHGYTCLVATSDDAMIIARACEIFGNYVRSVDTLLETILNFQRQPEIVETPKHRSAILDRSLCGLVSIRAGDDKEKETMTNYRRHDDGEVTHQHLSQIFRVEPSTIKQQEEQIIERIRAKFIEEGVMDTPTDPEHDPRYEGN